LLVGVVEGS
jgi:hypothetical protein